MGHRVAPAPGPRVEVRQIGERARGKEGMTDILDGALDAPFLGAPKGPARLGSEVIVTAEFEQARVEVNGIATAFENDGFEIVIKYGSGTATPLAKGMHMAQQEVLECLIEKELEVKGATVSEREHEAGETTQGTANGDRTEVGPISLCLLAGQSCQAQKGFVLCWSQSSYDPPQLDHTAAITAVAQHLIETGGAQARMLLKSLADEVQVRIGERGARRWATLKPLDFQSGAHRVWVQPQLGGNGANLPVLAMKQAPNICFLFRSDHRL